MGLSGVVFLSLGPRARGVIIVGNTHPYGSEPLLIVIWHYYVFRRAAQPKKPHWIRSALGIFSPDQSRCLGS